MRFLNWRAEENLVVNNKEYRVFMSRNYRGLIVAPWKFNVLKTSIYLPPKLRFSANICFKNMNFPRGHYQPIAPRQKHSI